MDSNLEKKTSFTLYDYYIVFIKYKRYILYSTAVICLISAVMYFFIIPLQYLSITTVKSTAKSGSLAGMLSATGLSGLGDVSDLAGGGSGATELALYENILYSRRCIEEAIVKFGLMAQYDEKYMQEAVKYFRENILEITKDKTAGTLTIGVYDENPAKAKEIVDFMVFQLNKINVELSVLNAKNNREFLEGRFNQIKIDLRNAEDSLKIYQDKFGIAPDITVKAAVQTQMQIEGSIKAEEVKLDLLKKILSPDQDEVKLQEEKIKSLKKSLDEMNNSTDPGISLKLKGSPEVVLNYMRLVREVEIQNKVLMVVLPMFEQSKVEEKKETPTVLILDQSFVPEKKAKPKRLTMTVVITLVGFIVTYFGFFAKERISNLLNRE
jgi:tyrosine-protein kinase Etk/Wzc